MRQLANKAQPELQEEARECFALNQYRTGIDESQISLGVQQTQPETVDEHVCEYCFNFSAMKRNLHFVPQEHSDSGTSENYPSPPMIIYE